MFVQDGLENHAARTPEKTALVCGGRRISYAELDGMANRIANGLIASGIRRGDRVGVYLPNTVAAVAGIFGILKAGAAFVVINQSTKFEKLSYIIGDSEAAGLITGGDTAAGELLARHRRLRCVILADGTCADDKTSQSLVHPGRLSDRPAACSHNRSRPGMPGLYIREHGRA